MHIRQKTFLLATSLSGQLHRDDVPLVRDFFKRKGHEIEVVFTGNDPMSDETIKSVLGGHPFQKIMTHSGFNGREASKTISEVVLKEDSTLQDMASINDMGFMHDGRLCYAELGRSQSVTEKSQLVIANFAMVNYLSHAMLGERIMRGTPMILPGSVAILNQGERKQLNVIKQMYHAAH